MTKNKFTPHSQTRISKRLSHLVDADDIRVIENTLDAYKKAGMTQKVYRFVKTFSEIQHIDEDNDGSGFGINGDCIVAVIKDNRVKTVMLAKSYHTKYFADGIIVR